MGIFPVLKQSSTIRCVRKVYSETCKNARECDSPYYYEFKIPISSHNKIKTNEKRLKQFVMWELQQGVLNHLIQRLHNLFCWTHEHNKHNLMFYLLQICFS